MFFNINHEVKVRLTVAGRAAHRKNHEDLKDWATKHGAKEWHAYAPPKEDENGWSKWQLWCLMQQFGPYLRNGGDVPFETEIEILSDGEIAKESKDG